MKRVVWFFKEKYMLIWCTSSVFISDPFDPSLYVDVPKEPKISKKKAAEIALEESEKAKKLASKKITAKKLAAKKRSKSNETGAVLKKRVPDDAEPEMLEEEQGVKNKKNL